MGIFLESNSCGDETLPERKELLPSYEKGFNFKLENLNSEYSVELNSATSRNVNSSTAENSAEPETDAQQPS